MKIAGFIQMIRQISLRNQMEESFSRIMQKSANQHQFSEQKILEAVELNKKVILHLNEIVFGDYFYQTVRDQIHMSLMDNTKVFVGNFLFKFFVKNWFYKMNKIK